MKTIDHAYEIIERLNEDAHDEAFSSWIAADELMESDDEDDWETAAEMREDASIEQATYFRENYHAASTDDREVIEYWLEEDEEFREQFRDWYGHDQFDEDF